MSSGVVYYKFKSQKDHDVCTFDGTGISVFDLKKEIIVAKKLGKGTDFDLALYNPQTDEEYSDDSSIIPRSASVIVRRLPASKPGKGTAQRYVNGYMPNSNNRGRSNGLPNVHGKMSVTFGGKNGPNLKPEQPKPKTINDTARKSTNNGQASADDDSEEAKIQAMFQQTSEQWAMQQEKMAEATPIYNSNHKKRTPNNNNHNQQNSQQKVPPPNYVCFRCGQRGHYINNCPTNGDKEYDKQPRIKRTTGIPRSFLKVVDEPKKDGPGGLMVTPQGGLVVAIADSASWEKHMAFTRTTLGTGDIYEQVPVKPELECQLCHHLFREAVSIPCCDVSFCDDCIRNYLLENDFTCPSCHSNNQIPDNLERNHILRKQVENYLRDYVIKLKGSQDHSEGSTPRTPSKDATEEADNDDVGRRSSLTSMVSDKSDFGEKSDATPSSVMSSSSQQTPSKKNQLSESPKDNKINQGDETMGMDGGEQAMDDKNNTEIKRDTQNNNATESQQQSGRTQNLQDRNLQQNSNNTNNNSSSPGSNNNSNNNSNSNNITTSKNISPQTPHPGRMTHLNNSDRSVYIGLNNESVNEQDPRMMLPNDSQSGYWDGSPMAPNGYTMHHQHNSPMIANNSYYNNSPGGEYYDESMEYQDGFVNDGYAPYGYGHPQYPRPYGFGMNDPSFMHNYHAHHYPRMYPHSHHQNAGIPVSFEQQYHPMADSQGVMFGNRGTMGEAARKPYNEKKFISQMKRPLDVVDVHAATHQARQKKVKS